MASPEHRAVADYGDGTYGEVYSLGTGEAHVGQVGGHVAVAAAPTFTRPGDTTAYASGDLVANSVAAGSVVPLAFEVGRVAGASVMLRRARIRKSGTSVTNAQFRLHLWRAAIATVAAGDNAALSTDSVGTYIGAFDVTVDRAFTDGAAGNGVPIVGSEISTVPVSGKTLYGLLEARAAYTPASAEQFTVVLEVLQN